jgi:hypothetical protein
MTQGWQFKSIYLYLVCFVTLMMIVFGLIAFINNVTRFVFPVDYKIHLTLMDLEREYINTGGNVPPVSELEEIREERLQTQRETNRAYLLRDLLGSLAVWLIPIPFYLYHWRKVREDLFAQKEVIQA